MPFTCDEIVDAFMRHDAGEGDLDSEVIEGGGGVRVRLICPTGPGGGYVRIWGPNALYLGPAGSFIVVERWNGVVGVRNELTPFLRGLAARRANVNIQMDPLGFGCGPNYGRYWQAIPVTDMGPGARYPTPATLVAAILAAFQSASILW